LNSTTRHCAWLSIAESKIIEPGLYRSPRPGIQRMSNE
jgi:hypothetical protein